LFFRVFKKEQELEVWATNTPDGPMTHVATYPICYSSGKLGPKERGGDLQVPEGFYFIDSLNPGSRFFLSMHVNYPNELDRHLRRTGSAIMVHGSCVSVGCLAMTTERIMELYLMVKDLGAPVRVPIHLFPQRDMGKAVEGARTDVLRAFWTNLKEGHDRFDSSRKVPAVRHRNGRYAFP
jgi:murein L,D-transpeptidase YafK